MLPTANEAESFAGHLLPQKLIVKLGGSVRLKVIGFLEQLCGYFGHNRHPPPPA